MVFSGIKAELRGLKKGGACVMSWDTAMVVGMEEVVVGKVLDQLLMRSMFCE